MTRRSGLGRGLDALLPYAPVAGESSGLREVPSASIEPNPRQPRTSFDEDALQGLASSIAQLGLLQPLLVRQPAPDRYELVAGERRLRAARLAGLERVPVMVVVTDEQGALERALVENIHREDLNPIEEAAGYRQLMDEGGLTQERLAERLGRSRATVANTLRLLDLPLGVQRLLVERRLSAAHGRAIAGLNGHPLQERLAGRAAQEGLSVRETEDLVRRFQAMAGAVPGARGGAPSRPPAAGEAQRRLSEHLGTRVRVEMGKRKGKLVLDFVSLDELERIVSVILGDSPGASPRVIRLD